MNVHIEQLTEQLGWKTWKIETFRVKSRKRRGSQDRTIVIRFGRFNPPCKLLSLKEAVRMQTLQQTEEPPG
ncbi:hypothetical protein HN858_02510 [Candidatus Falkowbacteria bacterium]|nr:hypothetical protein [Candidatus Falkowbacteria bacterium]MBT5503231.1 hypothetical protein [Candidatus Falkowbacteria bacterium]MBT6574230.1 hypothetical protein [Candidatus Falkowbacteria bacterium]MBT7348529.1 hypothetical protein [Candidatus Falkowbacteria bacterium]MBT7500805.1 hypothetical protein [Candidatus Falkowbacteria bacterium]